MVAAPLASLSSAAVAEWFHREITCTFGVPHSVRTDRGSEFVGMFASYCSRFNIRLRKISTAWPRAAGQVERINGIVKAGLRKCISAQGGYWSEWVSDVLWAVRALVSRTHGYSPYRLVFK